VWSLQTRNCVNNCEVATAKEQRKNIAPKDKRFVWLDLEMTGLNPRKDAILEIACVVTDGNLEVIAQGPDIIIAQSESTLSAMDKWCTLTHKKTGLYDLVLKSETSVEDAERQTLAFLRQHTKENYAQLAGNSVWMDRVFLMHHMPRLYDFLHYRTIDVSTIKELAHCWYFKNPKLQFKKQNAHRALDDIFESIQELKHYKNAFFVEE